MQLGLCYVFTSQKDIAHESFLKCQELFSIYYDTIYKAAKKSKNDEEAYISLMYLGVESNLWLARTSKSAQEAVKYFSLCWPLSDSKKAKDYLLYSSACEQLNDTNTSKQILKEGVGRFPDNVDLLFSYSLLLDDKEEILTILKKILQYESTQKPIVFDFGTVYNNIGWSLCCLNRYSEGLPYAEKAVRLNPEHAYAWGTLGHLYFYLNRYEDCVKVLTKALSMDNDENKKEHYEIRSKAYDKMGKNKLAQKDLEMARQYGD